MPLSFYFFLFNTCPFHPQRIVSNIHKHRNIPGSTQKALSCLTNSFKKKKKKKKRKGNKGRKKAPFSSPATHKPDPRIPLVKSLSISLLACAHLCCRGYEALGDLPLPLHFIRVYHLPKPPTQLFIHSHLGYPEWAQLGSSSVLLLLASVLLAPFFILPSGC